MSKKCTHLGGLLVIGLLLNSPLVAEILPDNRALTTVGLDRGTDGGCLPLNITSPLVREAVEQIASTEITTAFWNNRHHLARLVEQVEALHYDGLNPEHYGVSGIQGLLARVEAGGALSDCEIDALNQSYVGALKDLHYGRVDPGETGLVWYADGMRVSPSATILRGLASLGLERGIQQAFKSARPELPAYGNLRKFYISALQSYPQQWSKVPGGSLLSYGDVDARVPLLKQRLREDGYLTAYSAQEMASETFTRELSDAVVDFQGRHSLLEDGVVGPYTIAELNIQPATRLDQIRANLERFRWISRDRESTMVIVDIAGTQVIYVEGGQRKMLTRAQAGRPYRKTPTLKSWLTHVTVNPTWTVPPTILRRDVLPAVRKDPDYLASRNIRVLNSSGREIDPGTVNWSNPGAVTLRQDAGPNAALGKVALRFPNPFSVYLHDTPNKKLFETHGRFYSSGCVRVENAMNLVDLLFENAGQERLLEFNKLKASTKTRNITLPARVPLLMVYWTVTADEEVNPRFRPDIYKRDKALLALLDRS